MSRDQKRHQQSLQKKAAKRKQKQQVTRTVLPAPSASLRAAARWPLYECLISRNWENVEDLVQILVARRAPDGQVAAASFLVDLGCLGVKDAFAAMFSSVSEYEQKLRSRVTAAQPMVPGDFDLAAKIVREAVEYARRLGFGPHRDYYEAAPFLADADPDAARARVPLGKDGKPFFVAGPYDNVPRIIAKLEKAVGPGNFHFTVPLREAVAFEDEEEE